MTNTATLAILAEAGILYGDHHTPASGSDGERHREFERHRDIYWSAIGKLMQFAIDNNTTEVEAANDCE